MNDLRLAWRTISKSPGFTLATAGLLAAGIGVTTLIFSAVDAVVLRPLPVRHPEQLVRLVQRVPRMGTVSGIPLPVYEALRDRSTTFSAVFGEREEDLAMTEPAPAERIRIHLSTPNFFDALGVHAMLGRTLVADDAKDNPGDPPAVLSYGFWRRRFNGDPKALGTNLPCAGSPVRDCRRTAARFQRIRRRHRSRRPAPAARLASARSRIGRASRVRVA